ncbi:hypothetical protein HJ590_11300 [Naumannella sp. ID2617S]|nr:hypothetical protein [Naumannella sp. ID2617S]
MNNVVAAASCDPRMELWLIDAKGGVELRPFEDCAERFAETLEDATQLLSELLERTKSRFDVLKKAGVKKWRPEDGGILLVIDELAEITGTGTKESKEAAETLRRIIALGRAAGVCVVAATQKPDATTVPTGVRDLMASRLGHRCGARGQADVILPEAGDLLTSIPRVQGRDIQKWFLYLQGQGQSYSSIKRYRASLSSFFAWCVDEKRIQSNPVLGTKLPSNTEPPSVMRPFTEVELEEVWEPCRELSPALADIVLVAGWTGLRWGELRALRVSDVIEVPSPALLVSRSQSEGG